MYNAYFILRVIFALGCLSTITEDYEGKLSLLCLYKILYIIKYFKLPPPQPQDALPSIPPNPPPRQRYSVTDTVQDLQLSQDSSFIMQLVLQ